MRERAIVPALVVCWAERNEDGNPYLPAKSSFPAPTAFGENSIDQHEGWPRPLRGFWISSGRQIRGVQSAVRWSEVACATPSVSAFRGFGSQKVIAALHRTGTSGHL